jgi:uncharacterized protein (DUF2225 family)
MFDLVDGITTIQYLTTLNDENLAKEVIENNDVQNALLELLEIKTTTYCNVVLCPKCKYACFSKTIEYAYVCKNKSSPCHNRTTASDFGCVYGQKKEIEADV